MPRCFTAPLPIAHTCLDTSQFAAVFIDDVSDSPIIVCPGADPTNDISIDNDIVSDDAFCPPLANSTLIDADMENMLGERGMAAVDAEPADDDHADPHPAQHLPPGGAGNRGLKVGPLEYAYVVDEIWPTRSPKITISSYHLDIYDLVRATGRPNYLGARIRIPSDINCDAWDALLHGYHDSEITDYLRFGWPGGYTAPTPPTTTMRNHPSATTFPDDVSRFLEKEVRLGAMLGPFEHPPFAPWSQISPLMTVEKRDSSSRRVIIDLSFPEGLGVNSGVPKNYFQGAPRQYSLPTIEDLAQLVLAAGRGCFLWKADLERAYRQLRCDPLDYPLMGVTHQGFFFTDICPSFGCRGSSMSQQRVSEAVCYLLSTEGHSALAYVDDFCGVQPLKAQADAAYASFASLTDTLGLRLAPDKCSPPATQMEWLGFLFDTEDMAITLPRAKLNEIVEIASRWAKKPRASRRDLQQLAGKLNHVSQCILPARKFMSRILAALRSTPLHGTIPVTDSLRSDVAWFAAYAAGCNGRVLIKAFLPSFEIQCDACLEGGGGFSGSHYYSLCFSDLRFQSMHISQIEAFNIVLAVKTLLPHDMRSTQVIITTDNSAAMHTLNTGRTRDPILAACSRELWLVAALRELEIVVNHAPGTSLVLADALSRRHGSHAHADIATQMIRHLDLMPCSPCDVDNVLTPNL